MEIISTNINREDKKAIYRLTKAAGVNVKDMHAGAVLAVSAYCLYTDVSQSRTGEETTREVLSILVTDDQGPGGKISTISPTFIRSFMEIVDIMGEDPFSIIILKETSKGGREFVTCELDCN